MRRRYHPVVPILALLLARPVLAQRAPVEQLPVDPAVRVGTLENGVRYYLRGNERPENRAELRLVVNAGSVLEDEDQRGLAHFVEHMAFNGTEGFEKQEIVNYLESIGMRFGADLNAYTSFDETVYMLTVPTDTGTALATGVRILEEWAHRVAFDPQEIEKERGVVVEEWRLGRGAQQRLQDESFPILFRGSRYAERLPIGEKDVLDTFTRDALVRYYRDWYRPDLMAVIAVGDFDVAQVEGLIREHFARIPRVPGPRERVTYPVPDHEETFVSVAADPEMTASVVNVFYKQPARGQGTVADYRQSIVEGLYNAMLNARLSEIAQKPDPPFLGAFSTQGTLLRTKEAYIVGVGVPDNGVERGLDAMMTETERVARHGFAETELERQRANVLRSYESMYAERERTNSADYADEYVRAFLDGEAIPGIAKEYELVQALLPGITLDELNALARAWITDRNRVIVVQLPEKPGITQPAERELLAVFEAVDTKTIEPYTDVVADAPLVRTPPAPGTIVAESRIAEIGVHEWRLSNGVRVLLKPTDFKADEVLMAGLSPGGLSLAPDDLFLSASLATSAAFQGGVGELSLVDLQKALAGNTARVQPFIGELEEDVQGAASPGDLETMLQLTWLYITSPRADADAFASLKSRVSAQLANRDADPQTAFRDTLSLTLAQGHPRAQPLTAERLASWDLDRSLAFYRERFRDAGDFTFLIVGAFDPETLKPHVLQWLGGLPTAGREETWRDVGIRPPTGVIEKVVRKGIEPRSETQIYFTGPFDYTRENRYALASLRDVLDMKLRDVLREDLGGTYGVNVSQSAARDPYTRYSTGIRFGAAPERMDDLVREVFEQVRLLQSTDIDAETLAKVKETQRRTYETSMKENGFWLSQLAQAVMSGGNARLVMRYPELVDSLTPAIIRDAATRYLRADNYVRVTLVPESANGSQR
jgi:zinc protease